MKSEILYGFHPVMEALKARRRLFHEICLARQKHTDRIEKLLKTAEKHNIPFKEMETKELSLLAGTSDHQGIGARVSLYPLERFNEMLDRLSGAEPLMILVMDQVVDPRNLGALVRTALGVGIQGVVIPKDRSASSTPAVSKASAGALEHMHLARVPNLANAVKQMKKAGFWVMGLDVSAPISIFESDLTGSLAILIGAEEKGLRPLAKVMCDFMVSIPQVGPVQSLNASVAGAVVMYEAYRQRSRQNRNQ